MQTNHIKDHDGWNQVKKLVDTVGVSPTNKYFHEREAWFCRVGHNIGHEEDGNGLTLPVFTQLKKTAQNCIF